jgi:sterol desaturase/sphingolipid hydroxylase (fatty acid hydroxylase superfamily)
MLSWINETCSRLAVSAMMPVYDFFTDPSSRYYWLYCVSGIVIAAVVYAKHHELKKFRAELTNAETWASRSAINDYIIVVITPMMRLTILSWATINWQTVKTFVVSSLTALGVSGTVNDSTAVILGIALTITLFVVDDFLRWVMHYIFHRVPELWEFHKVHHSAEVLNFATAERHHPVEVLISAAVLTTALGVVNGLFIAFFGDKVTVSTIAGANVFLVAFNLVGGALRHSPFWITFGPNVEKWIISPAMHQIHHSDKPEHYDRNMGGSLAVWDRLFGTLHIPRGREIEGFGIGEETRDFRSMEVIMVRPFQAAARLLRQRVIKPGANQAPAHVPAEV